MELSNLKNFVENSLYRNFSAQMPYHSLRHILDVYETVAQIAKAEGATDEDIALLQSAALLHDYGFIEQRQGHEAISCKYARLFLPLFRYNEAEIEAICKLIMATRIGHVPESKLEKIIMDADLDYLGRDDFNEISELLFKELNGFGIISNRKDWMQLQLNFLKTHRFWTPYCINLREANKQKQITIIEYSLL